LLSDLRVKTGLNAEIAEIDAEFAEQEVSLFENVGESTYIASILSRLKSNM
jgi:hypothetical protein